MSRPAWGVWIEIAIANCYMVRMASPPRGASELKFCFCGGLAVKRDRSSPVWDVWIGRVVRTTNGHKIPGGFAPGYSGMKGASLRSSVSADYVSGGLTHKNASHG